MNPETKSLRKTHQTSSGPKLADNLNLRAIPGLSAQTSKTVIDAILAIPKLTQAILLGSRAKGTHRNGSDIDICIVGDNLSLKETSKCIQRLDDLNVPYEVDLLVWSDDLDSELRRHINEDGKELLL